MKKSDTIKRVEKLLKKIQRPKHRKVATASSIAFLERDTTSVLLSDGTVVLLKYGAPITINGILANKYSVHVWSGVDALEAHKMITAKEATEFRAWLGEAERQYRDSMALKDLNDQARKLGYKVVADNTPMTPVSKQGR